MEMHVMKKIWMGFSRLVHRCQAWWYPRAIVTIHFPRKAEPTELRYGDVMDVNGSKGEKQPVLKIKNDGPVINVHVFTDEYWDQLKHDKQMIHAVQKQQSHKKKVYGITLLRAIKIRIGKLVYGDEPTLWCHGCRKVKRERKGMVVDVAWATSKGVIDRGFWCWSCLWNKGIG